MEDSFTPGAHPRGCWMNERTGSPAAGPSADVGTEDKWARLMDGFERHLRAEKGLADLTIRNYRSDLQPLFDFMQVTGIPSMEQIDRHSLRDYLAWLMELGYVRSSVVRKAQHPAQLPSLAAASGSHSVRPPAQAWCRQEGQTPPEVPVGAGHG